MIYIAGIHLHTLIVVSSGTGALIHFSDEGGGGGLRVRKISKFSARAAKSAILYD